MRILGVDPGEQRLGVAVSDPTGTIASPLTVIQHVSRSENADAIARIAEEEGAVRIVVGQSRDEWGEPTYSGRRAARLAGAIRAACDLPVELWDESGSTRAALEAQIALGVPRAKRRGHADDLAAAVILQSYLDALERPDHE